MSEPAAYEELIDRAERLRADVARRIGALEPAVAERVSLLAAQNLLRGAIRSLRRAQGAARAPSSSAGVRSGEEA